MRMYLSLWHGLKPWPYRHAWNVIASGIAGDHGFTLDDIIGKQRGRKLEKARQHVMYVLSKRGNSSAWIGRQLNRHHSTILWGIAAHKRRMVDEAS